MIISWVGMRGIVSLAAAMAIPAGFPDRDLIVLTAFAVVLGTLVIQGLTLKLLGALNLHDDDPVGREVSVARDRAARAQLHRRAVEAARRAVVDMRTNNEIGDDAFHEIEEELDWLEMADKTRRQEG